MKMDYYWFNKEIIYFHSVKNEKQMLKFSDVVVNKKKIMLLNKQFL